MTRGVGGDQPGRGPGLGGEDSPSSRLARLEGRGDDLSDQGHRAWERRGGRVPKA